MIYSYAALFILVASLLFMCCRYRLYLLVWIPQNPLHWSLEADWRMLHAVRNHPTMRSAYHRNLLWRRKKSEMRTMPRRVKKR